MKIRETVIQGSHCHGDDSQPGDVNEFDADEIAGWTPTTDAFVRDPYVTKITIHKDDGYIGELEKI